MLGLLRRSISIALSFRTMSFLLGLYGKHSTTTAKPLVGATVVYCSNVKLTESRCTHDARFNSYEQVGLPENRERIFAQYKVDGKEFGMPSALQ